MDTIVETTYAMVFSIFQREFWSYLKEVDPIGKVVLPILAALAAILFPLLIPVVYLVSRIESVLSADDSKINIFTLTKLEILKLQAKLWFTPIYEEPICRVSWDFYLWEKLRYIVGMVFIFIFNIIAAPIMFTMVYIFFISTQKFFAKKAMIVALKAK